MRTFIFISLLFISQINAVFAVKTDSLINRSIWWSSFKPDGSGNFLKSNFEGIFNSTAIQSEISNAFLFRNFIDKNAIDKASGKLKENKNLAGGGISADLGFFWTPNEQWKNEGNFAGISYELHQQVSLQFNSNLFDLIMRGNGPYAGTLKNFDNLYAYQIQYQIIKVHYLHQNKHSLFRVSAGLAKGDFFSNIRLGKASVFTEFTGEYLDIELQGNVFRSTRSNNSIKRFAPSAGPVLDLAYSRSFGIFFAECSVVNLGFIKWNKQSTSYLPDTMLRYSGIRIDDIFNWDAGQSLTDTIQTRLLGAARTGEEMAWIPARISGNLQWKSAGNLGLSVGFNHLFVPGFRLQKICAVQFEKNTGGTNMAGIKLGLIQGGFGNWNTFIQLILLQNKRHALLIGTSANEGWINPKSWKGNGLLFSYQWKL